MDHRLSELDLCPEGARPSWLSAGFITVFPSVSPARVIDGHSRCAQKKNRVCSRWNSASHARTESGTLTCETRVHDQHDAAERSLASIFSQQLHTLLTAHIAIDAGYRQS
jgi:hypothetical protein